MSERFVSGVFAKIALYKYSSFPFLLGQPSHRDSSDQRIWNKSITSIPWAVSLSWLENAYSRPLLAGDFDP